MTNAHIRTYFFPPQCCVLSSIVYKKWKRMKDGHASMLRLTMVDLRAPGPRCMESRGQTDTTELNGPAKIVEIGTNQDYYCHSIDDVMAAYIQK